MCLLVAGTLWPAAEGESIPAAPVTVLTSSTIDAYGQALEGLLEGFDDRSCIGVVDLSA